MIKKKNVKKAAKKPDFKFDWGIMRMHKKPDFKGAFFNAYWFLFDKKHAMNAKDALLMVTRHKKMAKAKVEATYDVIYAKATKHRSRKIGTYMTFVICPKPEANIVFAFPKKFRKLTRAVISKVELPF